MSYRRLFLVESSWRRVATTFVVVKYRWEERDHLHHLGDWILACLSRIFLFTCLIIQPIGWG